MGGSLTKDLMIKSDKTEPISPRITETSGYFFIENDFKKKSFLFPGKTTKDETVLTLKANENKADSNSLIWKVQYVNMEWPQQYFRLYHKSERIILCTKKLNENENGSPSGYLAVINEKEFDTIKEFENLFYLDKCGYHSSGFAIKTMFGMCIKLNDDESISLVPETEIDNKSAKYFWNLIKVNKK
jgi:hypothetical protein